MGIQFLTKNIFVTYRRVGPFDPTSGLDKCKDTANCGNMLIFGTHIAFSAINHLRNSAHEKNQNGRHFSRWLPFSMKWSDRSCL